MASQTTLTNAQAVSESANEILRNMSDYFGKLATFSMDYDADTEIITSEGQKLQLGASGKIVIRRPDGAHITRDGVVASTETFYDGKTLTLFGKKINSYYQVGSRDGLDAAIDHFRMETGMDAPGADLLLQDSYSALIDGVQSGEYISDDYVDGVQCYHLAFREADVDWQLWVRADDHPVPMKYVITTKWLTGAPQYSIRLRNWNFEPQISDDTFNFTPPEGAFKMDHIEVSQTGELKLVGAQ
jgi:hypothetical protein